MLRFSCVFETDSHVATYMCNDDIAIVNSLVELTMDEKLYVVITVGYAGRVVLNLCSCYPCARSAHVLQVSMKGEGILFSKTCSNLTVLAS